MNRAIKTLWLFPGALGAAAIMACAHPGPLHPVTGAPNGAPHRDTHDYLPPTFSGAAHGWSSSSSTTGQASPPVVGSTKATSTGYGSHTGHTKTPCPPTPPATTTTGSTPTATVSPPYLTSPSAPTSAPSVPLSHSTSTTAARTSGGTGSGLSTTKPAVSSSGLANTGPKAEQLAGIGGGLFGLGLVVTFFGVRWTRRAKRGH